MAESSKFAEFIQSKGVDARRVVAVSHKLESLRLEDRAIKLAKRRAKTAEGDAAKKETGKPRSGRPITERAIQTALKGGTLSGPTKTRILRAVNKILEQKKQEAVDLRALF